MVCLLGPKPNSLRAASAATTHRVSRRRRHSERELVLLYQQDPSTRETVIEAFRPLAQSVARRYHRGEEPLEDLEQVALLGLVKALERFDPDRGSPFATYAMPTMTGEVRRHYRDTGWAVHVSRGAQELAQKIAAVERATTERLTAEEVAKRLGVTVEDVVTGRIAQRAMRADSLDRPRNADDGDAAEAAISPAATDDGLRGRRAPRHDRQAHRRPARARAADPRAALRRRPVPGGDRQAGRHLPDAREPHPAPDAREPRRRPVDPAGRPG